MAIQKRARTEARRRKRQAAHLAKASKAKQ